MLRQGTGHSGGIQQAGAGGVTAAEPAGLHAYTGGTHPAIAVQHFMKHFMQPMEPAQRHPTAMQAEPRMRAS